MGSVVLMTEYQRRREGAPPPRPAGGAEIVVLAVVQRVRDQPVDAGEPRQQRF